jgi:hypothetical protein
MNRSEQIDDDASGDIRDRATRSAISEFFKSLEYFAVNYPRRTLAVFAASLTLVLVEFIGAAMIMPLLAIATGQDKTNRLIEIATHAFEAIGLHLRFFTAFVLFMVIFVRKSLSA